MSRVTFDMSGLNGVLRDLQTQLGAGASIGPVRAWVKQIGVRYLAFTRTRYSRYSRGGGDWAPLSPETIKRRRKARAGTAAASKVIRAATGGDAAILVDTGTLFGALNRGAPGNRFEDIPGGVRVGWGDLRHAKTGKGAATLADIAHYHQTGAGRLPARPLLVEPDAQTITGMMGDGRRAVERLLQNNNMRGRGSGGGGGI